VSPSHGFESVMEVNESIEEEESERTEYKELIMDYQF